MTAAGPTLCALMALWLCIAPRIAAQNVTGSIEGWVTARDGSPLADVAVAALGRDGRTLRTTISTGRGHFRLVALPVGACTVLLRRVGYRPTRIERVVVRLGATVSLGVIGLSPGTLALPQVVVHGERPLIDLTTTAGGGNLQSALYEALPVDRNSHALPALLPQANLSYFGDEVNIAGSSGPENVYYIDGVNVTDPYRAGASGDLPSNFIKEVEVLTGGYEAEYGRALGGIVNLITRSGGSELEGEAFGFFSHSGLSAASRRGLADAAVDASADYDAGLSLAGPIVRNRLWFFTAYNRAETTQDIVVPGFPVQQDHRGSDRFAAKLDWQLSERTSFAATILGDPGTRRFIAPAFTAYGSPTGLANIDPFLGRLRHGGVGATLRGSQRVGKEVLLESLLARFERDEVRLGNSDRARREPLVLDLESGGWSGGFGDNSDHHSVRWAGRVVATWSARTHMLKAGVEYEDNRLDAATHFTDPGIVARLNDTTYQAVYLITNGTVRNRVLSAFLQDSWLLSRHLRVNAGLRWDGQYLVGADGRVAQPITDGLQPRIGLIVMPDRARTKLFASFGRFFEQLPLFASATWWHAPVRNGVYFFDRDPRSGVAPLDSLDSGSHDILPEVPGLRGQHFDELTAGLERALGTRLRVGVRGVYRTLGEVIDDGLAPVTRERILGNPGRGALAFLPRSRRKYYALELTARWRRGTAVDLAASYTLSRNHGNYTGLYDHDVGFELPNGKTSPDLDEQAPNGLGLLPNDRPHVFKVFGALRSGFGLALGTLLTWQSGTPVSELGATTLPAHFVNLRPRGTVGRTPVTVDLNLRLTYRVPLGRGSSLQPRVILDLLHVAGARRPVTLDQVHFSALDAQGHQTTPNPNYLAPTRYQPPMMIRLGTTIGFQAR